MRTTPLSRAVTTVIGVLALVILCAPLPIVVLASLDPSIFFTFPPQNLSLTWYEQVIGNSGWRAALVLSLVISVLTALICCVVGGLAGIGVAHLGRKAKPLFNILLVVPLIIPVIVIAISYYGIVLRLHLVGNLASFVMADTILGVSIVALFASRAASGADPMLEYASLSLGAGRLRTLWNVTVPVVLPATVAGGALAFLGAMDEVVISIFLVSPGVTPLSVKIFSQVQTSTPPLVMAAASILILVALAFAAIVAVAASLLPSREGLSVDILQGPPQ